MLASVIVSDTRAVDGRQSESWLGGVAHHATWGVLASEMRLVSLFHWLARVVDYTIVVLKLLFRLLFV